jgi:hypothetical protein
MGTVIGIDVGQRRDPTAVCVVQTERRPLGQGTEEHFLVRYLERLPLGTPYPDVADRLASIAAGACKRAATTPVVYVDATGVGQPVVDVLRRQCHGGRVTAVYFNHGDRRIEASRTEVRLGKAWLVSRLQVLLQAARVHLPRTPESEALAVELLDYEIRVDSDANDRYGAFKVGTHDDLVTALGLAVQEDHHGPLSYGRACPRTAD